MTRLSRTTGKTSSITQARYVCTSRIYSCLEPVQVIREWLRYYLLLLMVHVTERNSLPIILMNKPRTMHSAAARELKTLQATQWMNGALEARTTTELRQDEWWKASRHERSELLQQTKTAPSHKTIGHVTAFSTHKVLFAMVSIPAHKGPVGAHYPPDLKIAMGSLYQNPSLELLQCTN